MKDGVADLTARCVPCIAEIIALNKREFNAKAEAIPKVTPVAVSFTLKRGLLNKVADFTFKAPICDRHLQNELGELDKQLEGMDTAYSEALAQIQKAVQGLPP